MYIVRKILTEHFLNRFFPFVIRLKYLHTVCKTISNLKKDVLLVV